ncbi:hypothetical protein BKA63DRAFT_429977 [Paraphoma chrysanthemicola]|nr:hypothetical protein BKA63DRAFT_429977 [Paraphoma chrysanthemicola]
MSNVPNTPSVPITNPAFTTTPPVDPNAFVQAMSFMATPAGAHSMAAFASHMAHVAGAPYNQPSPSQSAQQSPRYSPSQQAGQKRKREERKPQQQGSKPPRARAAVPPPIPTFGFTLPNPTSVQSAPASTKNKTRNDRQGKVRLGLGSSLSQDESSSEDEDIDEEAALAARLKGGGYAFEHEGEQISLQTAGDVADWIKDRRRNFPTQQKALEKAHAAAIKRRNELEFVRKLKGKPTQLETRPEAPREKAKPPRVRERSEKDMKKQEELAALRKKLHESMMKKQQGSAAVDLGLGYGSETQSDEAEDEDEESSVLSDSSIVSSSEESSDDSEADSDGSDAAPEPISSKITPAAIKMPPPIAMQTPRMPDSEKIFKHPVKEEKRTGLYEKLVEQELVRSDQLALDAIKYLGQNGFLG